MVLLKYLKVPVYLKHRYICPPLDKGAEECQKEFYHTGPRSL